ncbi:MAG TPA: MopE-related protein [Kofleriaceae bacterium]|nr:MopE-related protein [Kofleriaceae bacterium]
MKRVLLLILLAAATQLSCSVNEYCVNCAKDDGGNGDGNDHGDGGQISDGHNGGDACVPDGTEICDGADNDCDGKTDEDTTAEPLPHVGEDCSSNVGECTAGKTMCVSGKLTCSGKTAVAETCNDKDDNCDGMTDNGDPGGGAICGTDMGECISGVEHCVNGAVVCTGNIDGNPETCDGKDNDCDGMFDEDIPPLGSCGPAQGNTGECKLGMLMCAGGGTTCVGAVYPTFELCDNLDQDCDGDPHNGYDLQNDARNCGTCGHVCAIPHGTAACTTGACAVGACDPGFFDVNKDPSDGCEYACDFNGPQESCNGLDDNCNGQIDENVTPPPGLCRTLGACAGSTATCNGVAGFSCNYGPNVSKDANGNIVPESTCDDIDNDCNGVKDDPFPTKGQTCHDANKGICQGTGTNVCNGNKDGVTCMITMPGQPMQPAETCNGLDDDCDGVVDNGANGGNLAGQSWITLATGHQIMQYEASRADAKVNDQGNLTITPCSKSGVEPWTDVTAPQAQAACAAITGAHLCSEEEWQRACAVVTPTVYPLDEPSANNGQMFLEAEDFYKVTPATTTGAPIATRTWEPDYTIGFSGMMAMHANPDTGANLSLANAFGQGPRLDYEINFKTTGNHYVWVLMYSPNNSGNTLGVGVVQSSLTPAAPTQTLTTTGNGSWMWIRSAAFNVTTLGNGLVEIYMREDGMKVDAVLITRSNSTTAPTNTSGPGHVYAYDSSPDTYAANTCNGADYDTDSVTPGDQDDIIPTGSVLTTCDASWSGSKIFDLTGNVQEWTAPRIPGVNPIRGGASNDIAGGLTCALAFAAADDTFFFPNVGFRCCR